MLQRGDNSGLRAILRTPLCIVMAYQIKEIFYTLQGEGLQAGRPAVFCRFAGCNFWNGREQDRAQSICSFCDTDFVGTDGTLGGTFREATELARHIAAQWPAGQPGKPYVVLTGGEPLLQVDDALVDALHAEGFEVAVETNGSITAPAGIDWICVSPKSLQHWVQRSGNELKLVWPQAGMTLHAVRDNTDFAHYLLQPLDDAQRSQHTQTCITACLQDPRWRLSLQTHKITGIR